MNFKFLRTLCLGACLAILPLSSAFAESGTRKFGNVTMHYDTVKKEVDLKTDAIYNEEVESDIQKLLHFYTIPHNGSKIYCANLKLKKPLPMADEYRKQKSFSERYQFSPNKVTFNNVTYELKNNVMTISSSAERVEISPACIGCFGTVPDVYCGFGRLYQVEFDRSIPPQLRPVLKDDRKLYKVIIIGNGFKYLPSFCFANNKNLKEIDMTQSGIYELGQSPFDECPMIERINLNPMCVSKAVLHTPRMLAGNYNNQLVPYRGRKITEENFTSNIQGNILEVVNRYLQEKTQRAKDEIDAEIEAKIEAKNKKKQEKQEKKNKKEKKKGKIENKIAKGINSLCPIV